MSSTHNVEKEPPTCSWRHPLVRYLYLLSKQQPGRTAGALVLMVVVGLMQGAGVLLLLPMLEIVGVSAGTSSTRGSTLGVDWLFNTVGLPHTLTAVLLVFLTVAGSQALLTFWQTVINSQLQQESRAVVAEPPVPRRGGCRVGVLRPYPLVRLHARPDQRHCQRGRGNNLSAASGGSRHPGRRPHCVVAGVVPRHDGDHAGEHGVVVAVALTPEPPLAKCRPAGLAIHPQLFCPRHRPSGGHEGCEVPGSPETACRGVRRFDRHDERRPPELRANHRQPRR